MLSGKPMGFSLALLFSLTTLLYSCVSIKPSTVELSTQVGQRISEMEGIHQKALQRYFDMEKQKVEDFLTRTWEPLFLKNFLGTSNVLQLLQNVSGFDEEGKKVLQEGIALYLTDPTEAPRAADKLVSKISDSRKGESGAVREVLKDFVENKKLDAAVVHISSLLKTDEPARIIFEFAEAAHNEMQAQRKELLAPIDEARMEASASLSEAYAELIRGQSTITGRLEAAAKRTKQQDELLEKFGVKEIANKATESMANLSTKVNNALTKAQTFITAGKEVVPESILNSIKEALNLKTDVPKK